MDRYTITAIAKDHNNGSMNTAYTPNTLYRSFDIAKESAMRIYRRMLSDFGLEDNNACDENGTAIPGGCVTTNKETFEAVIYDYIDCESGCLSERAFITIEHRWSLQGICECCGVGIEGDEPMVVYEKRRFHEQCFTDNAYGILINEHKALLVNAENK